MFAQKRKYLIDDALDGKRVDQALAVAEIHVSRQYFQKLVKENRVCLGKKHLKSSYRVKNGDEITVDYPAPVKLNLEPVAMPLEIVYEDDDLLVVNKEAGMVVHPAAHGRFAGQTLVNAVLAHVGEGLKGIGGVLRPGIVHRLDKDTSGLIIIAKSDLAQQRLSAMFKNRQISKKYIALVYGNIKVEHGQIVAALGRHPMDRKKRAVDGLDAREAHTEFRVMERFDWHGERFTLVDVTLHTGRTHQIRVHFQSIRHPLVGDKVYGNEKINALFQGKFNLSRQFLHAYQLTFRHPINDKQINLQVDWPADLQTVLKALRQA